MKENEKLPRTLTVTLGGAANAPCPECGRRFAFFDGKQGDFISETKTFTLDTVVVLHCPVHGDFIVRAGDFHNPINRVAADRCQRTAQ